MSSPYISGSSSVSVIMLKVIAALLPATAAYLYFFGPSILVNIVLATITALACEAAMLRLRKYPVKPFLLDGSALVTAWLLALSMPPLAPWWLVTVATAFAIVVAKHLYGGLGNNLFNPAMVGYAVMLISFPVQMTQWLVPQSLMGLPFSFAQQLSYIFTGSLSGHSLDALTMATPLDTIKTHLTMGQSISEIRHLPIFGAVSGKGTEAIALAYLLGGLYLLQQRIITWHIPVAFILGLALPAAVLFVYDPQQFSSPLFHLAAGGAMIGAFFIATDPVTGATTPRGKLIFGGGIGALTYLIRLKGGYPDGVAFAVLLLNICVPLIDAYTQPPIFGKKATAADPDKVKAK